MHNPQERASPNSRNVGVWLDRLSSSELDEAFEKYSEAFFLQGEIKGEVRRECEIPLMLRLLAEVFTGATSLPSQMSSKELFDEYWKRKLALVSTGINSELILSTLAKLLVENGVRQIPVIRLGQAIGSHLDENTYRELVRLGLLRQNKDSNSILMLSFEVEKIRSYAYVTRSRLWPTDKSNSEIAMEICQLLQKPNQLIIEAVDFYVVVIDQGESDLLTEVALTDLSTFIGLVSVDPLSSLENPIQTSDDEEGSHKLIKRLTQYAMAYSRISGHYFTDLCTRIAPYSRSPVGVLASENGMCQFRSATPQHPEEIAMLPPEVGGSFFVNTLDSQTREEYGNPAGKIRDVVQNLEHQIPHKLAWEHLTEQIAELLAHKWLDESTTPSIMQERIRELLFDKPPDYVPQGISDRSRNYQKIGLETEESVYQTNLTELSQNVSQALEKHLQERPQPSATTPASSKRSAVENWHIDRTGHFLLLQYYLNCLATHQGQVEEPIFTVEEIFTTIRNPEAAIPVLEKLIPTILRAYRRMVERNFGSMLEQFMLYKSTDSPVFVEITRDNQSPWHSSYLEVRYVLLPTSKSPQRHIVYASDWQSSLANQTLRLPTTYRMRKSEGRGHRFGEADVSLNTGKCGVVEGKALIYRTEFPNRNPITDQVYQLIRAELESVLGRDDLNRLSTGISRNDYQHRAWLMTHERQENRRERAQGA